jgi:hypothetical protein
VLSTHLFDDIDEQMLADHSSLAFTQRYIEGDSKARRKIVGFV